MRKYTIQLDDGKEVNMSYVGLNYAGNGIVYDDVISSFSGVFNNSDEIIIDRENDDLRIATLGDITKAYEALRAVINSRDPRDANVYLECVQQAVIRYFGPYSNRKKRIKYYPTEEEVKNGKERGKISNLGIKEGNDLGNSIALSLERSVVAQNLLLYCCIDVTSYFKTSLTNINGKNRVHSYNLVHDLHSNRYYVCDFSIPSFNGVVTPIICEIPQEIYEKMISPLPEIGCSVIASYTNIVNKKEYLITYDTDREDVYDTRDGILRKKTDSLVKKKV